MSLQYHVIGDGDEILFEGDRIGMEAFLRENGLAPGDTCIVECFETRAVPFDLEVVLEEDTDEQDSIALDEHGEVITEPNEENEDAV